MDLIPQVVSILHFRDLIFFIFKAKPDYSFSYGVQDPASGNTQIHKESRDGSAVHGEYRVLQSDGIVRIVRYTADAENGFQATVEYEPHNSS